MDSDDEDSSAEELQPRTSLRPTPAPFYHAPFQPSVPEVSLLFSNTQHDNVATSNTASTLKNKTADKHPTEFESYNAWKHKTQHRKSNISPEGDASKFDRPVGPPSCHLSNNQLGDRSRSEPSFRSPDDGYGRRSRHDNRLDAYGNGDYSPRMAPLHPAGYHVSRQDEGLLEESISGARQFESRHVRGATSPHRRPNYDSGGGLLGFTPNDLLAKNPINVARRTNSNEYDPRADDDFDDRPRDDYPLSEMGGGGGHPFDGPRTFAAPPQNYHNLAPPPQMAPFESRQLYDGTAAAQRQNVKQIYNPTRTPPRCNAGLPTQCYYNYDAPQQQQQQYPPTMGYHNVEPQRITNFFSSPPHYVNNAHSSSGVLNQADVLVLRNPIARSERNTDQGMRDYGSSREVSVRNKKSTANAVSDLCRIVQLQNEQLQILQSQVAQLLKHQLGMDRTGSNPGDERDRTAGERRRGRVNDADQAGGMTRPKVPEACPGADTRRNLKAGVNPANLDNERRDVTYGANNVPSRGGSDDYGAIVQKVSIGVMTSYVDPGYFNKNGSATKQRLNEMHEARRRGAGEGRGDEQRNEFRVLGARPKEYKNQQEARVNRGEARGNLHETRPKQVCQQVELQRNDTRHNEVRQNEVRQNDGRQNDTRQNDGRQNDTRQNDGRLNDTRQNDGRQNDTRQNDGRLNDTRQNDGRQNDTRQNDGRLNDSRQNDGRLNDTRQNDGRQNEARQNDERQNYARQNDGRQNDERRQNTVGGNQQGQNDTRRNTGGALNEAAWPQDGAATHQPLARDAGGSDTNRNRTRNHAATTQVQTLPPPLNCCDQGTQSDVSSRHPDLAPTVPPPGSQQQQRQKQFNDYPAEAPANVLADIPRMTPMSDYVEESVTMNGLNVGPFPDRPPTPDSSIHIEIQDYKSSDEEGDGEGEDSPDRERDPGRVGWTFYNNVVGQVNEILQANPSQRSDDTTSPPITRHVDNQQPIGRLVDNHRAIGRKASDQDNSPDVANRLRGSPDDLTDPRQPVGGRDYRPMGGQQHGANNQDAGASGADFLETDRNYQPSNDRNYQPSNDRNYQPSNDQNYRPSNDRNYLPPSKQDNGEEFGRRGVERDGGQLWRGKDAVRNATMEQLRQLGVSVYDQEGGGDGGNDGGKKVTFDSVYYNYPRMDFMRMQNAADAEPSDVSMRMNALAMKYLKDDQINEYARLSGTVNNLQDVTVYNVATKTTNMSFATMRYLERYQLLPPSEGRQAESNLQAQGRVQIREEANIQRPFRVNELQTHRNQQQYEGDRYRDNHYPQQPVERDGHRENHHQQPTENSGPSGNHFQQPTENNGLRGNRYLETENNGPRGNHFQQPMENNGPRANHFQQPTENNGPRGNHFQQPAENNEPRGNRFQQPSEDYEPRANHYQQPFESNEPRGNQHQPANDENGEAGNHCQQEKAPNKILDVTALKQQPKFI